MGDLPAAGQLPAALAVLSAMLTPAVLILASSSLVVATSARLGRMVDRARKLAERFEELARRAPDAAATGAAATALAEAEHALLYDQLRKVTARARLLQRALFGLFVALSLFLATSIAIGVEAATGRAYAWLLVTLGMAGVGVLLVVSMLLIAESQVARAAIDREMAFIRSVGEHHAPAAARERAARRQRRRSPLNRSDVP